MLSRDFGHTACPGAGAAGPAGTGRTGQRTGNPRRPVVSFVEPGSGELSRTGSGEPGSTWRDGWPEGTADGRSRGVAPPRALPVERRVCLLGAVHAGGFLAPPVGEPAVALCCGVWSVRFDGDASH